MGLCRDCLMSTYTTILYTLLIYFCKYLGIPILTCLNERYSVLVKGVSSGRCRRSKIGFNDTSNDFHSTQSTNLTSSTLSLEVVDEPSSIANRRKSVVCKVSLEASDFQYYLVLCADCVASI